MTTTKGVTIPQMVTINIRCLCLTNQIVFVKTGCKYLINMDKFVAFLNGENKE